ncbi:MAG: hypothetical protein HY791_22160 [Deltaproteobacteria bacterium]|nr:hypothetical protein [Deltaproteobacteria bacterium]
MNLSQIKNAVASGAILFSTSCGSLECGPGTTEADGFCTAPPPSGPVTVRPKAQSVVLKRLAANVSAASLLHPIEVSYELEVRAQSFHAYALVSLFSTDGSQGCVLGSQILENSKAEEATSHSFTKVFLLQPSCEALVGGEATLAISFDPFQAVELEGRADVDTSALKDPLDLARLSRLESSIEAKVAVLASAGRDVDLVALSLSKAAAVLEIPAGDRPGLTAAELQALFPDDPPEAHPDGIPAAVSPRSTLPNFSADASLLVYGMRADEEIQEGDLELSYDIRPLAGGIGFESTAPEAREWLPLYTELQSEGRAGDEPTVEELLTDYLGKLVGPTEVTKGSPLFVRKEAMAAMVVGAWKNVLEFEVRACVKPQFDEEPNAEGNNCGSVPIVIVRKLRTPDDASSLANTSTQSAAGFASPGIVELKRTTYPLASSGFVGPVLFYDQVAGISSGLSSENVFGATHDMSADGSAFLAARMSLGVGIDFSPLMGPWNIPFISVAMNQFDYRTQNGLTAIDSFGVRKLLFGQNLLPFTSFPWAMDSVGVQRTYDGIKIENAMALITPVNPIYSPTLDFAVNVYLPAPYYVSAPEDDPFVEAGLFVTGSFGLDAAQAELSKTVNALATPNPCATANRVVSSRPAASTCNVLVGFDTPRTLAEATNECLALGGALTTFQDLASSTTPALNATQVTTQVAAVAGPSGITDAWFGHHFGNGEPGCPGFSDPFPATSPGSWSNRRVFCGNFNSPAPWQGGSASNIPNVGPRLQYPRPFPFSGLVSTWPNLSSKFNQSGFLVPANDSTRAGGAYCTIPSSGTSDSVTMTMVARPKISVGVGLTAAIGSESDCNNFRLTLQLDLINIGVLETNELRVSYFPSRKVVSGLLKSKTVNDVRTLSGSVGGALNALCIRWWSDGYGWNGFSLVSNVINPESTTFNYVTR